jgi:NADH-quinone oxidoreductase subunit G
MQDTSSNAIHFDMKACIACQACVRACKNVAGQNVLKLVKTGPKPVIQTKNGKPLNETNCIGCGQCTIGCVKHSIFEADAIKPVEKQLKNKNGKVCICQVAPAIRINMAEALGVPAGSISTGKVVTALKMLGFDYVFDTNYTADVTIVEEASELIGRITSKNAALPMFTSCCPAWINYVEKNDPSLIPNLSSCRSPMSMLSSLVKNELPKKLGIKPESIYNVAIMPCTAKKDEAARKQFETPYGKQETDAVITSRELVQMIKKNKINFKQLKDTPFDTPYSESTGGAAIFCATGGVMEAAVRCAYKLITKKDMPCLDVQAVRGTEGIKKASVNINGLDVNVAVVHGIKNAMNLIKKIKAKEAGFENIHFVEVMACPGGCVAGGGSPKAKTKKVLAKRLEATYKIDKESPIRNSMDNKQLIEEYKTSLGGKFNSHIAHELLHTHYTARKP